MKEDIKIGNKVWIVDNEFKLKEKTILEISDSLKIVDGEKQTVKKYKIDNNSCGGVEKKDFFIKRSLAEKYAKEQIDKYKYNIGTVVMIKNGKLDHYIGRIMDYENNATKNKPYIVKVITDWSGSNELVYEEKDLTPVNNNYIETFEDSQDIIKELENLEREYENKYSDLQNLFDELKKDLKTKFREYDRSWYINKKKKYLKFRDIFNIENNDEE